VLTPQMFGDVFAKVRAHLDANDHAITAEKLAET
jgi:hypothetical protein